MKDLFTPVVFFVVVVNTAVKQACIFNYDLRANIQNADISLIAKKLLNYTCGFSTDLQCKGPKKSRRRFSKTVTKHIFAKHSHVCKWMQTVMFRDSHLRRHLDGFGGTMNESWVNGSSIEWTWPFTTSLGSLAYSTLRNMNPTFNRNSSSLLSCVLSVRQTDKW